MTDDFVTRVVDKMKTAPIGLFMLKFDESTYVANCVRLAVYARCIYNCDFRCEFILCKPLETTTKACDIINKVSSSLEEQGLKWENVGGICTDGAPAMIGFRTRFQEMVKNI